MKKFAYAGAAIVALAAIPVLAQPSSGAPMTRAAVQSRVQAQFASVDANRDGFVTQAEAASLRDAARAGRRADRADRRADLFARLDTDNDGSISRAEFDAPRADGKGRREARADRREKRAERRGERRGRAMFGPRLFQAVDSNKDQRVSFQEASAAALARFDRADTNRDGTISIEERRAARQALRSQRQAKAI